MGAPRSGDTSRAIDPNEPDSPSPSFVDATPNGGAYFRRGDPDCYVTIALDYRKMKIRLKAFTFSTVLLFHCALAHAQDSNQALLETLVQKKILTPQEAEKIKADTIVQDNATQAQVAENKIKLSAPVKEMYISGELMLRYFYNEAEEENTNDHGERNRYRYRLRLNDTITLTDDLMIGIRVEANNSSHSGNVTLGGGASTQADAEVFDKGTISTGSAITGVTTGKAVVGFDAKTGKPVTGTVITGVKTGTVVTNVNFQDALFFAQIYAKYQPFEGLSLYAGKMPNPLISTRMVWDPDINPEGFAEQYKLTLGPWGGKHSVDSKEVEPAEDHGVTVDVFANLAQFLYEDVWTNYFNSSSGAQTPDQSDVWMLSWQIGAKVNFNKDTFLQIAPTIYNYLGNGSVFGSNFNGDGPAVILNSKAEPELVTFNQEGTNNLFVFDMPAEFDWKLGKIPFRVFGDFAHNFQGAARARNAGHPDKTDEDTSYQVGAGIGRIQHGGDFELLGWWQYTQQYALDPNIVDDDIFDGRLNMEGFYLQATYAFTDSLAIIIQGSLGHQIDNQVGTAGSGALGDPAGLPLREAEQFYVDLRLKF